MVIFLPYPEQLRQILKGYLPQVMFRIKNTDRQLHLPEVVSPVYCPLSVKYSAPFAGCMAALEAERLLAEEEEGIDD